LNLQPGKSIDTFPFGLPVILEIVEAVCVDVAVVEELAPFGWH
jgi:hypothetical protein